MKDLIKYIGPISGIDVALMVIAALASLGFLIIVLK